MKAGRGTFESLTVLGSERDEWEINSVLLTVFFAASPWSPFSVTRSSSFSLFSCLAARCSPFLHRSPLHTQNSRSARGPFGVRHLCSVLQSAIVLFILDLFGVLESPPLIDTKIFHLFSWFILLLLLSFWNSHSLICVAALMPAQQRGEF